MTLYARIAAGAVAELLDIPADGPPLEEMFHPDLVAALVLVPAGVTPAEGWTWDGEGFAPPVPPEATLPAAPSRVTARQARLALHAAGLLGQVETAVTAIGGATQIEWEYATVIERASPLLAAISGGLGLTAEQVDALFIQAAGL